MLASLCLCFPPLPFAIRSTPPSRPPREPHITNHCFGSFSCEEGCAFTSYGKRFDTGPPQVGAGSLSFRLSLPCRPSFLACVLVAVLLSTNLPVRRKQQHIHTTAPKFVVGLLFSGLVLPGAEGGPPGEPQETPTLLFVWFSVWSGWHFRSGHRGASG